MIASKVEFLCSFIYLLPHSIATVSAYLDQLHALETFDFTKKVSSISAKTLIVAGGEDRVVPPQNAAWLKEKIHNAEMEILGGVGHMVPIEAPDRLAMKILSRAK